MKTSEPIQLRVLLAPIYLPILLFLQFGEDLVVAMTGNAHYTTPVPALAVISAALDDLRAKITAANAGGKLARSERNTAWTTAKGLLRQLAAYVQLNCQNDIDILLSSGFSATKIPAPIGPLGAPQNVRLSRKDMEGQIYLQFTPVYGTTAGYTVQTAPAATGPFTDYVLSSKSRVFIDNQTPLQACWVRVRATGTAGAGPWSEVVSIMVL